MVQMLTHFCLNMYSYLSCLECHNGKIKGRRPYPTCKRKNHQKDLWYSPCVLANGSLHTCCVQMDVALSQISSCFSRKRDELLRIQCRSLFRTRKIQPPPPTKSRTNWNIFPLMLLACSVDTPIHINRSHCSRRISRRASCVDWALSTAAHVSSFQPGFLFLPLASSTVKRDKI